MLEFIVIMATIVGTWCARGFYDRYDWSEWIAEWDDDGVEAPVDDRGREDWSRGDPRGY